MIRCTSGCRTTVARRVNSTIATPSVPFNARCASTSPDCFVTAAGQSAFRPL